MWFSWPRPAQIPYRLWRLRRLIVFCLFWPVLAGLATGVGPGILMLMCAGLIAHVVLFPNGMIETVTLSWIAAALMALAPAGEALVLLAPEAMQGRAQVVVGFIAFVAAFLAWMWLQVAIPAMKLAGVPRKWPLRATIWIDAPVAEVADHYRMRPDHQAGRSVFGPADADGVFDVTISTTQLCDLRDLNATSEVTYRARIIDSDAASHDVLVLHGEGAVTVCRHRFAAEGQGTRLVAEEVPDAFPVGMHAGFWLRDYFADSLVEGKDALEQRSARANTVSHHETMLTMLGRAMQPRDENAGADSLW